MTSGPGAGQRPGDHQSILRTRHAHVEQPPLLLDPLLRVGVHDGQVALGGTDDEHDRPLEALRGVQGGDGHAVGRRRVRQLRPALELLDQLRHRAAARGRDLLGKGQDRGQGLPALPGGSPAGRPGRQPAHPGEDGVGLLDQAVRRVGGHSAPGSRSRSRHLELGLTRRGRGGDGGSQAHPAAPHPPSPRRPSRAHRRRRRGRASARSPRGPRAGRRTARRRA